MENKYKPVIIVVAYNRLNTLQRLLFSLLQGNYPSDTRLIISIDRGPDNKNIHQYASDFYWPHGEKEVIYRKENLGIRAHIISCANLVNQYGSVIILEDDLYVSPHFYQYTQDALDYYDKDDRIAGISLFHYPNIEKRENPFPFIPLLDDSDIYFIQYAASSGQAWTKTQWNAFYKWYKKHTSFKQYHGIVPFNVMDWPLTSWKKFFITYMIENNKYFVFPTISLSTNFDDRGSNRSEDTHEVQSRLKIDDRKFTFKPLSTSFNLYDAYFEILPEKINLFNKELSAYDYDVDLYGIKRDYELKKAYVLTTKKCEDPLMSFGRYLKPHEMNVILNISGNEIALCKKENIIDHSKENKYHYFVSDFSYFYRKPITIGEMLHFSKYKIMKKLNSYLKK